MIKLSLKQTKSSVRQEFLNSKLGRRESMTGDFFQGGRGGGLALILSLCDRGVEIKFCLMRRGV